MRAKLRFNMFNKSGYNIFILVVFKNHDSQCKFVIINQNNEEKFDRLTCFKLLFACNVVIIKKGKLIYTEINWDQNKFARLTSMPNKPFKARFQQN